MILSEARVPDGLRVYAIGDVHGCVAQLESLYEKIKSDVAAKPLTKPQLVFLGDYVDRGPENRAVIDFLIGLQEGDMDCVFLMGNHDERMISFIKNPELVWDDMMKWGGVQTLASYGVIARAGEGTGSVSDRFGEAVPQSHVDFIKSLPVQHEIGDYFFCHAGVRPGVRLSEQTHHDLIWIRYDFTMHEQPFEKVIVHGHTPNSEPEIRPNRINVDTRCYDSGILTALVLEGNEHRFLQTGIN